MRDLVSIMKDEALMIRMGIKMSSDDEADERREKYSKQGISEYSKIISSSNPGYVLWRRI